MEFDSVLTNLVKTWGIEKIKSLNIMNQNGANLTLLHGRDMAHKLELTDEEKDFIMPFPPKIDIRNNQEQPPKASLLKRWGLPLAAAAILGPAGGLLTNKLLEPKPIVESTDDVDSNVGFTIE